MRGLVLGATGFIGAATVARLLAAGHQVRAVTRPGTARTGGVAPEQVCIDIARATDPANWTQALDGIDAVLNCAGVFQDSPRDSTVGVHAAGPAALYRACMARGVTRVVHLSAIGAAGDRRHRPAGHGRRAGPRRRLLASRGLDRRIDRPLPLHRRILAAGRLLPDAPARSRPRRGAPRRVPAGGLPPPLPRLVRLRLSRLRCGARDLLADDRPPRPRRLGADLTCFGDGRSPGMDRFSALHRRSYHRWSSASSEGSPGPGRRPSRRAGCG